MPIFNFVRRTIVRVSDVAHDALTVIDSLPVPVVDFHLVPQSHADGKEPGADFSKVPSKKQTIFGYKLHLLATVRGVITVGGPSESDGGWHKGYISAKVRARLQTQRGDLAAECAALEPEAAGIQGDASSAQSASANCNIGEQPVGGPVSCETRPCPQFLGLVYTVAHEDGGTYTVPVPQSLGGQCGVLADQASCVSQRACHPSRKKQWCKECQH